MRFLVDTNVFLDFYLQRGEQGEEARNFFYNCYKNRNQTYVTSMSLRDIEYVAHRLFHNKEKSKMIQMEIYELVNKVIGISSDSAIESLYSDVSDYEDSLLIEAAKEEMLDAIITNNKKDFINSDVPVFTPKEICNYLNQ